MKHTPKSLDSKTVAAAKQDNELRLFLATNIGYVSSQEAADGAGGEMTDRDKQRHSVGRLSLAIIGFPQACTRMRSRSSQGFWGRAGKEVGGRAGVESRHSEPATPDPSPPAARKRTWA